MLSGNEITSTAVPRFVRTINVANGFIEVGHCNVDTLESVPRTVSVYDRLVFAFSSPETSRNIGHKAVTMREAREAQWRLPLKNARVPMVIYQLSEDGSAIEDIDIARAVELLGDEMAQIAREFEVELVGVLANYGIANIGAQD